MKEEYLSAGSVDQTINDLVKELTSDHFRPKSRMQIIFTRHVNDDDNAGMMGKWRRDMISEGSW